MSTQRRSAAAPGPSGPAVRRVPGPGATTRRREATRERVLDAARDVFAERGVFGGTVEEICARAGFTRGAFYSNFGDKDEVLRALIAREHDRLLSHLDAHMGMLEWPADPGAGADPRSMLAEVADRLLRSVPADRQFSLIQDELEIHAVRDPALARVFGEADARFRARIAAFLERGMQRFGRELVVDLTDATDAVVAIVERSFRRALLAGGDADPYALATVMLPLLMVAASRPIRPDAAPASPARRPGAPATGPRRRGTGPASR